MQMTNQNPFHYSTAAAAALISDMHNWMTETLGDVADEMMPELIEMYIEDSMQIIVNMDAAIQTRQWVTVQKAAHTLKGSSASVGLHEFSNVCKEIETAVKNNESNEVAEKWPDMKAAHLAINEVLQAYLDAQ